MMQQDTFPMFNNQPCPEVSMVVEFKHFMAVIYTQQGIGHKL